jgi:hypothetical protein
MSTTWVWVLIVFQLHAPMTVQDARDSPRAYESEADCLRIAAALRNDQFGAECTRTGVHPKTPDSLWK